MPLMLPVSRPWLPFDLMRHPLATILAVVALTSAGWYVTLSQLSGSTYSSIPDHSTRTQFPGP